ncbi:MAG: tetratricopeptide repeat protein [Phycisphaerales bacterium]|nr:tetratricopeptide repeat protein [Phycisphaerales bacterium]
MEAEALLRDGRLDEALKSLQDAVRKAPSDPKLRVFLFQLQAVRGDWEKALTQLNVAADMDPGTLLMAQVCRPAIACEALRAEIFAGKRTPLVMGQPQEWLGLLIQAAQHTARGEHAAAEKLRERALDAAPTTPGKIDGTEFEWIADADSRLGPVLEAVVEGRYYWVPFTNIKTILIEKPADLRDVVWAPAHFRWVGGGETVGLIPARYAGTELSPDPLLRLGRRTDWEEQGGATFIGRGQRLLATDAGEFPLLAARLITIGNQEAPGEEQTPDG